MTMPASVPAPASLPAAFLRVPLAHRGLHDPAAGRPENTRAAVRAAVDAGYGVEIDVQPSSDGQAMVFHDEHLARLTGQGGETAARPAAELQRLRVLESDETIPTLRDILGIVAGRVPLLVEVKDQHGGMGAIDERLETVVAQDLRDYAGPVAVMSFNPHSVAAMARLAPGVPRGLTTAAYDGTDWGTTTDARRAELRGIPDYDRVGASFISHEAADLARPRVAELRSRGAGVLCWTIRSPLAEGAARKHAHNITFESYLPAVPPA
ncbi:glycerophosphodiester phosphodiesterase family protein [Palleronia sp. KMU-117]|uniref:glycerophosphodiester phosphodiesterase family protein n=1 Tax=Palleronia sp. KMU-117 TaxID=3434108 RepID=UPI003D743CD1